MRDGVEERLPQLVRHAQHFGLGRFALQAEAFEREAELMSDRRQEAIVGRAEVACAGSRDEDDRPYRLTLQIHRHAANPVAPQPRDRPCRWRHHPDPAPGLSPLRSGRRLTAAQHHLGGSHRLASQSDRLAVPRVRLHPDRALFAEDDDRRGQLEFGPDPLGDSSKSALEFRIGHQAHNVIEHDGLALSCLCLACYLAEQGG